MTQLLVSVRNVGEADTALAGGADIIDVKEPGRGALGRADDAVLAAIAERVGQRRHLSAALGELSDGPHLPKAACDFVKVGLAGCARRADWPERLAGLSPLSPLGRRVGGVGSNAPRPRLVAVAYADAARAQSPPVPAVLDFAISHGCAAMLIDTWSKDGCGLLDWLTLEAVVEYRRVCAAARLPLALAGSLSIAQIERLRVVEPDIIAVRTAACRAGRRDGEIDLAAVQGLARVCRSSQRHGDAGTNVVLSTEYSVLGTSRESS